MKIILDISEHQLKKVAYLSSASDAEIDKVTAALSKYTEIDITDTIADVDDAKLAFAAFAIAAIAELEGD